MSATGRHSLQRGIVNALLGLMFLPSCVPAAIAILKNRLPDCYWATSESESGRQRRDLEKSKAEREGHGLKWSDNILDNSSTQLYQSFARLNAALEAEEAKGCTTYRHTVVPYYGLHTSFQKEWEFQQAREQSRVDTLARNNARVNAREERRAEERAEWKRDRIAEAKKHGYKGVAFDVGLTRTVWAMVEGELSMAQVKVVVIELDDVRDPHFTALQVLGPNKVLYATDLGDEVLLLRNYGETVLEGAPITALRSHYLVIRGVTTYRTVTGTKQAIIVETAW
jgi:hypothetical protein